MPLLNFKKQFAEKVESGEKCQTIRATRKIPIKEGDTLYLYTGLRTKSARKLNEVKCKEVLDIDIGFDVVLGDSVLNYNEKLELAKADGFADTMEFIRFFIGEDNVPFSGQLIKW